MKSYYYRPSTYSIRFIQSTEEVFVSFEQQMVLYQFLDIAHDATLDLEGEVVLL